MIFFAFYLCRACVSFGPRNRSIGAAAKSQVCFLSSLEATWRFILKKLWKGSFCAALRMNTGRSYSAHAAPTQDKHSSRKFTVCLLLCLCTGCHKLQEHSPRVQTVSWQSVFRSLCAVHQKQPGLWYCTNAFRNNRHKGEKIKGHLVNLKICRHLPTPRMHLKFKTWTGG